MKTRTKLAVAALATASLAATGITAAVASGDGHNGGAASARSSASIAGPIVPEVSEGLFVPVAPCRIVDTRKAGGKLANGAARNFYVRGTTNFLSQGGKSGGCGVPAGASAVTLNVTVTGAGGTGYLSGYPSGTVAPPTNFVTYWGDRTVTSNPTIKLATAGTDPALAIKNVGKPAHVIIDVTGYFAPQMGAYVETNGTLTYSSGRVLTASHPSTGNYVVTFDRDVSTCSFAVTPYSYNYTVAVGPDFSSVNAAHVFIHDQGSPITYHDTSFFIQAVC